MAKGYIKGYPDGTFRPQNTMTRAEFATILSRIAVLDNTETVSAYYSDLNKHWAQTDIIKLQKREIIPAAQKQFKPNQAITRAEVVVSLSKILNLGNYGTPCDLNDIQEHPYRVEMAKAYNAGIITGYPDGAFKPDGTITRAEMVSIFNRVFAVSTETSSKQKFSDVKPAQWYYEDISRAVQK